jgi:hypothetical protein
MKISIDNILNTALNIKNQKDLSNNESKKTEKQNASFDSIEIRSRLSSRLGRIQGELKNLQSSLTQNQIIKDGLTQVINGIENDNGRINNIVDQVKFEKKLVLGDFLENNFNYDNVINGNNKIDKIIDNNIVSLKSLQVEIENITASNLADDEIAGMVANIEKSISDIDLTALQKISDLKPDAVAELIR